MNFDHLREFQLAAGVSARCSAGTQVLIVDGQEHAMGPMQGYVLPGGTEHSAYCGPERALALDVFRPVREDYRERWQALG